MGHDQRGRLQTRVHPELGEQVLHMRASRAPVYAKLIGYLLGAQTIQDACLLYTSDAADE